MGTAFYQVATLSVDVLFYLLGQHAEKTENKVRLALGAYALDQPHSGSARPNF